MPTVLVTGANRGLGLELARQYAGEGWQVIVANRTPLSPRDFAALGFDITELRYDALNESTASDIALRLKNRPIDLVIMNAGTNKGANLPPEDLDAADWDEVMLANTYAPLRLAALLEPNLRLGNRKTLVAISAFAASSAYDGPRQFAYSASKAALNQLWRNLSIDWRDWGCICLSLIPGDISKRLIENNGMLPTDQAALAIREVIESSSVAQGGLALDCNGVIVPW